jgi:hypothetical protein
MLALAFLPALATADDDTKPLTPEAAAKKLNEKCTVEMEVRSTGKGEGVFFLNSKDDFKATDNFTIFINKEGVEKWAHRSPFALPIPPCSGAEQCRRRCCPRDGWVKYPANRHIPELKVAPSHSDESPVVG